MVPMKINGKYRYEFEGRLVSHQRLSQLRHPEQYKARKLVSRALSKNKKTLKWQPCEICGSRSSEAHHEDYNKPLEVRWLCKQHHIIADKEKRAKEVVQ